MGPKKAYTQNRPSPAEYQNLSLRMCMYVEYRVCC